MPEFTAVDSDAVIDISCKVCLEPWDGPVEVIPCTHIFCGKCLTRLKNCPECRGPITSTKPPNRVLSNMANDAKVRCTTCSWSGTREDSRRHTTCASAAAAPALPQQQQPQQPFQPPRQEPATTTAGVTPAWAQEPAPTCAPPQRAPQQQQQQPRRPSGPWHGYGMTQDEYDHIMCVFMTFDVDGSGELSRNELTTLCRYLNYAQSPAQVEQMFAEMDSDRSGMLSMHEFCTWVSRHRPDPSALYGLSQMEYEEVLFAFHSHDRNQDGFLSESELTTLLMQQRFTTSASEASRVFQQVDIDRDGRVTLDEYLRFRSAVRRGGAAPGGIPPMPPHPAMAYQPPSSVAPQHAPPQRPPVERSRVLQGRIDEISAPFNFKFTVLVSIGTESFGTGMIEGAPRAPTSQPFTLRIPPGAKEVVFRVLRHGDGLEIGGTAVNLEHVPTTGSPTPYARWMPLTVIQPAAVLNQTVALHVNMSIA